MLGGCGPTAALFIFGVVDRGFEPGVSGFSYKYPGLKVLLYNAFRMFIKGIIKAFWNVKMNI